MKHNVTIYTDGSSRGNPGPGGYGAILITGQHKKELSGGYLKTTNNRMEMTAAVKALHAIRNRDRSEVIIYSDSNLMVKGMNEWLTGWKAKGWRNASKKPVENKDLWVQLDELSAMHDVTWQHVKGHDGNEGNELADRMSIIAIGEKDTDFTRYKGELDIEALLAMRAG